MAFVSELEGIVEHGLHGSTTPPFVVDPYWPPDAL